MIKLTEHCKIRYCERILKLNLSREDLLKHMYKNNYEIEYKIIELFYESEPIIRDRVMCKNGDRSNFYINGNTIIITDIHDKKIVTIYKISDGFSNNNIEYYTQTIKDLNAKKHHFKKKEEIMKNRINYQHGKFDIVQCEMFHKELLYQEVMIDLAHLLNEMYDIKYKLKEINKMLTDLTKFMISYFEYN